MNSVLGSTRLQSAAGLLVLLAALGAPSAARGQVSPGAIPSAVYFKTIFGPYADGDYIDALASFQAEGRAAIKSTDSRWVDSICYHTMAGECYYQMGRYQDALDQYNAALNLYVAFPTWMLRVNFQNPTIAMPEELPVIPWGRRKRVSRIGKYPDKMMMGQGQIDNTAVLQRGGVIQAPMLFPVGVTEIVRCTTLAMRHRRDIMGPLCKYDQLTTTLASMLAAKRPAPPNHWSQAWIDVELGVAYAAAGNPQAAKMLEHGVTAGEFDHPLTSTALLELGRLSLESGNLQAAARFFEETTYSAVYYPDPGILEEAFRFGQLTHVLSNAKGMYPPLLDAAAWAKLKNLRQLNASLLTLAAENAAILGDNVKAAAWIADARASIGNRPMGAGCLGARLNHALSMVAYQTNNLADGDRAIAAALAFQQTGSLWIFQIGLADALAQSGGLSERNAMAVYGSLLRDPAPADWMTSPLESLSVMVIPHLVAFEHWLELAFAREREQELALEISDRLKRHRFYSTLPLGGRLLSLRWILEGSEDLLSKRAQQQKQDLLVHYPRYQQLAKQAREVRAKLADAPLSPETPEARKDQTAGLDLLASIGHEQETILRQIAVRHEPADLVFPPLRTTREIQQSLPPGHVLLAFVATSSHLHAFMFSNEKYRIWSIGNAATVQKQVSTLLRDMGNVDANHELGLTELGLSTWKKSSARVWNLLFDKSGIDLAFKFEEFAIVPDGFLWYVPFESLQIGKKGAETSLLSRVRVRYAPTVGLAVPYRRLKKPTPSVGVVLGRMYPKEEESVVHEAFDEIARAIPGSVALPSSLPAPPAIYRSLFDDLIVLDDIRTGDGGPYSWSPAAPDRGKHNGSLATWFALPWGGPQNLILPGFHTPAESALNVKKNTVGNDLFLSVCGIMSTGVRTVLISRWRTAGQSSIDLVREFAQELPHTSAADAWQRSVELMTAAPLNLAAEPRLKRITSEAHAPKAEHPFFWAGYMLVDSGIASENAEVKEEKPVLDFKKKAKPGEKAAGGAGGAVKGPAKAAADDEPAADLGAEPADADDAKAADDPADDAAPPPSPKPATPKSKGSSSVKRPANSVRTDP